VEELRGAVRGGEEVLLPLYRAEGKGEGARPRRWRGVGGRPAINGGGARCAAVSGRGRLGDGGVGGDTLKEEGKGRGEAGRRRGTVWPARHRELGELAGG
jgi:hypothetical protein